MAGILSQVLPADRPASWLPWLLYGAGAIGVAWAAGYLVPPSTPGELFEKRRVSARLMALSRYAVLSMRGRAGHGRANHLWGRCCSTYFTTPT